MPPTKAIACLAALLPWLVPALSSGGERPPLPRGHVFFQADFESPIALAAWSGPGKLGAGYRSARALCIERPASQPEGSAIAAIRLPVEEMRGHLVLLSAWIKAEGVTVRPRPWNGIKFMAPLEGPRGKSWPQAKVEDGSFEWRKVSFAVRVPREAREMSLCLGLESVAGKVWFDDLRISSARPPAAARPLPAAGPPHRGHDLPRLRGAMVSPGIDEEGLRVLGKDWNANLIRWQLIRPSRPGGAAATLQEYDRWLQGELKKLDGALPLCEKYGLLVALDLHSPPGGKGTAGGYAGSDGGLFAERACQEKFVEVWRHIARRYKDSRAIWGYDLANEPVEDISEEGLDDWGGLAERAARAIREIDPERTIILEPSPWGSPEGLADFEPIDVPNVVYSVHMYIPSAFTHQGVFGPGKEQIYPGEIDGKLWNKAALEEALRPAAEFQKAHGAQIYIGEFSAIRWAPEGSACRYLRDVIEILEAHGWDWSYHAFREWQGWSVEHGSDRNDAAPTAEPTDREKLLREWFARNEKPRWKK